MVLQSLKYRWLGVLGDMLGTAIALWLKPRAEKGQSPREGTLLHVVVSEGDFAPCKPANSLAGHHHRAPPQGISSRSDNVYVLPLP